jgi:hypothetical protein
MIHYNEHKIKVIRNYLGLIIQKQIIKTSKSKQKYGQKELKQNTKRRYKKGRICYINI